MYASSRQGNAKQKAKKKTPRNAFSFYLDDQMVELRRMGRKVSSKAEIVPLVCDKWKEMSADEKVPYQLKAKQWKMSRPQARSGRLDCTGQPIDSRVDMDAQSDWLRKENRKAIRSSWPNGSEVCNEHFYIISFQSLFELPDEEGYQPCEVACVDYTLNKGIVNVWHQFIDHGPIKLGLRGEIKIFTDRTHQIPVNFEAARSDYGFLWHQFLTFVKGNDREQQYPPLFTRVSEMKKTKFCLEWLSAKAGVANQLTNVCEFEDIAAELYPHAGLVRPSVSSIKDGCEASIFDFESNAKCDYHDELENIHCAVLTVKKCCYWMSDAFQQVYGYEITDRHLPVKSPPCYTVTLPEQFIIDNRKPKFTNERNNSRFFPKNKDQRNNDVGEVTGIAHVSDDSLFNSRDIRCTSQYKLVQHNPSMLRESDISSVSSEHSSSSGSTVTNEPLTVKNDAMLSRNAKVTGAASENVVRRPTVPSKIFSHRKILAANFNINENNRTIFSESDFPSLSGTYSSCPPSISPSTQSLSSGMNNLTFGRGKHL